MRKTAFFVLAALLCLSCRQGTDLKGHDISVTDDYDSLYTATLEDGKVRITFNLEKCERYAVDCMTMCRVGPDPVFWEGLDEDCVGLVASQYGEGINPCLTALTDQGHVAFLNISDAIFTGDMMCSGPLAGFENVKSISTSSFGGVLTDEGTDRECLIPECDEFGYYYCGDMEIVLTRDWNCYVNSLDYDFHIFGALRPVPEYDADGPDCRSRRYSLRAGESSYVFEIRSNAAEPVVYISFVSGDWPETLVTDNAFEKCFSSKWAD